MGGAYMDDIIIGGTIIEKPDSINTEPPTNK